LEELLGQTFYEAKIVADREGNQKIANVRKLIEMARSMEESHLFGIEDFVRYLESLAERDIAEAEARIQSEESDSVVLLIMIVLAIRAKSKEHDQGQDHEQERETSFLCLNLRNLRLTWRRRRNGRQPFIMGTAGAAVA
jgi:hypothetical protein